MALELIRHPRYGTIKAYDLFGMEQTIEQVQPRERSARLGEGNAAGDALAPSQRMVQVPLPFL